MSARACGQQNFALIESCELGVPANAGYSTHTHTHAHTHTHTRATHARTQPFYSSLDSVRDNPDEPVPEEHSPTHTYPGNHTHNTNNRFTALLEFVRDYPGEQVPGR